VTVIVAANIARCAVPYDQQTAALLDTMPGTIITAGDDAFPFGTAANYSQCYDAFWGRHKARTWASLGNHDYDSSSTGQFAFDYFGERAGPRGKGFYSMNLGAWHVIVLNDNISFTQNSEQETWLRADLAADTAKCTLAIWHQPLFLSSNTAGFTSRSLAKILWDDLYAANADVVVNGHQHDYERMAPMDPAGNRDDARGIRQFNSGVGGDSYIQPTVRHPNSETWGTDFGVLRLTLRDADYDWQFVHIAGASYTDQGSGTCH
jgi:hypothetical protein